MHQINLEFYIKKKLAPKFYDNFLFLIKIILQFSKILDTTRNYICEIINLSIFFAVLDSLCMFTYRSCSTVSILSVKEFSTF